MQDRYAGDIGDFVKLGPGCCIGWPRQLRFAKHCGGILWSTVTPRLQEHQIED